MIGHTLSAAGGDCLGANSYPSTHSADYQLSLARPRCCFDVVANSARDVHLGAVMSN